VHTLVRRASERASECELKTFQVETAGRSGASKGHAEVSKRQCRRMDLRFKMVGRRKAQSWNCNEKEKSDDATTFRLLVLVWTIERERERKRMLFNKLVRRMKKMNEK
jgi:hypothetical protein